VSIARQTCSAPVGYVTRPYVVCRSRELRAGLSFTAQSLLVAVPVVVGSLGRIPIGALTNRLGARVTFPVVSLVAIVPVLTLASVTSFPALLVTGFFLGMGGTAIANLTTLRPADRYGDRLAAAHHDRVGTGRRRRAAGRDVAAVLPLRGGLRWLRRLAAQPA